MAKNRSASSASKSATVARAKTPPGSLGFADYLEEQAKRLPTKGQRTRCRFKAAAARILADKGFHTMQMSDICNDVGLSQGAIYKYFANKKEISVEVMTEFLDRIGVLLMSVEPQDDEYLRTYHLNLQYVRIYEANVGLMRCIRQLSDEIEEFTELWHSQATQFYQVIAGNLAGGSIRSTRQPAAALLLARSLAGMVNDFLDQVYVRANPDLEELASSPEKLAETVSILWYRQAFAENPPPDHVRGKHPLLAVGSKQRTK